jgi:uncharacterized protein (TIGR02757 family)
MDIKKILDAKVKQYNTSSFIQNDPIQIPHIFTVQQDIEIAAFFAAILAWGNRTSIINSCTKLMRLMDNAPHQFITNYTATDVKPMHQFVHRTFNNIDLLYCLEFLQFHYSTYNSLETAFHPNALKPFTAESGLIHFRNYFFSLADAPHRTTKHISTPQKKSACKRLNMLLRWMVRKDNNGVDFGLWKTIKPSQLICPLDVHVANVACRLGLIPNNKSNWDNAVQLTDALKTFDAKDPVKYDYALFSLGADEKFN